METVRQGKTRETALALTLALTFETAHGAWRRHCYAVDLFNSNRLQIKSSLLLLSLSRPGDASMSAQVETKRFQLAAECHILVGPCQQSTLPVTLTCSFSRRPRSV